jgi:hypothetical protein
LPAHKRPSKFGGTAASEIVHEASQRCNLKVN